VIATDGYVITSDHTRAPARRNRLAAARIVTRAQLLEAGFTTNAIAYQVKRGRLIRRNNLARWQRSWHAVRAPS
jgi:hypothetical protein